MSEKAKKYLVYGERLREERKRLKKTQQEFADLGNVTIQTQQNYESGRRAPGSEYLNRLAEEGVDIAYVLTDRAQKEDDVIRLPRFGAVTGLKFDQGGFAEVRMGAPEIERILEALIEFEQARPAPDNKILEQLAAVREHFFDEGPELLAEAVIGSHRVAFEPIPREE